MAGAAYLVYGGATLTSGAKANVVNLSQLQITPITTGPIQSRRRLKVRSLSEPAPTRQATRSVVPVISTLLSIAWVIS